MTYSTIGLNQGDGNGPDLATDRVAGSDYQTVKVAVGGEGVITPWSPQMSDFDIAVHEGLVPGWRLFRKFGGNSAATGTEDLWAAGGVRVLPSSAGTVSVVSDSADDAAAGTGARTFRVEGLLSTFVEDGEDVTLNGTTPVAGAKSFIRIHRSYGLTGGTGEVNAGNISASIGADVQSRSPAGYGQSQQLHYTVPESHRLILKSLVITSGAPANNADVEYRLQTKAEGSIWRTKTAPNIFQSVYNENWVIGEFPARTDIRIQSVVSTGTINTSAVLCGYLVQV